MEFEIIYEPEHYNQVGKPDLLYREQLTLNQLWLLSVAANTTPGTILEGLCRPGTSNGRGLRQCLAGLEKRGLVVVTNSRWTTHFAKTETGRRLAARWHGECLNIDSTEWDEAAKKNREA